MVAGMAASTAHAGGSPQVQALTVDDQATPIGIDDPHPSLPGQRNGLVVYHAEAGQFGFTVSGGAGSRTEAGS